MMSRKGYESLDHFISSFGTSGISFVVGSEDSSIQMDYYNEIKELCIKQGIVFFNRKDAFNIDTDYIIAVSWRWLIKQENSRLIVMHDSLLPKYRGFAPLVNCLVNGEKQIGVTALFASDEYDQGDIIAQQSLQVSYPVKINEAIELITGCYKKLIEEVGRKIISGVEIDAKKQIEEDASYSLWLDESDYDIDWSNDAVNIQRFIDSVGFPYNGASTYIDGRKVRILDAEALPDLVIENRKPGKIIFIQEGLPVVVCGNGLLKIKNLVDGVSAQEMLPLKRFRIRFT